MQSVCRGCLLGPLGLDIRKFTLALTLLATRFFLVDTHYGCFVVVVETKEDVAVPAIKKSSMLKRELRLAAWHQQFRSRRERPPQHLRIAAAGPIPSQCRCGYLSAFPGPLLHPLHRPMAGPAVCVCAHSRRHGLRSPSVRSHQTTSRCRSHYSPHTRSSRR